ncbi:MAG: phosphotransferase, partial [Amphiplicatus sp.]
PTALYATYSRRSFNSILILDDLARQGAEFCKHDAAITRRRAESQLALLAKLHGKFYQKVDPNLRTWEEKFELSNKWFNLEACCNNGFLAAEEVVPPRLFKRHAEIWPATVKSVDLHRTQPRTLTHNDPHLRNWYITRDGEMGLADWQCICRSDWGRDVAFTISTSLSVENRRAWEKELLGFYLDKLRAEGCPAFDFDEVFANYRRHLFSALAYWTVTLTPSSGKSDEPPPEFQPRDATLEFIKRMTTAIDDLDSLGSFG